MKSLADKLPWDKRITYAGGLAGSISACLALYVTLGLPKPLFDHSPEVMEIQQEVEVIELEQKILETRQRTVEWEFYTAQIRGGEEIIAETKEDIAKAESDELKGALREKVRTYENRVEDLKRKRAKAEDDD